MKTYNSPMLQFVSIKKNDIVTGSNPDATLGGEFTGTAGDICAPERFNMFGDSWANAGY